MTEPPSAHPSSTRTDVASPSRSHSGPGRRARAKRRLHQGGLAVAFAVVTALGLAACGGADTAETTASTTSTEQPPPTTTKTSPKKAGPTALDLAGMDRQDAALIAGYLGWTELTAGPTADLQGLGSAHPGDKRIWASPQRDALTDGTTQTFPYPAGTVIVKEARTGSAVTLVALMEKTGTADPANGGWRYVEYTRQTGNAPYVKVGLPESGCAGCHSNANTRQETDWVFWSLR